MKKNQKFCWPVWFPYPTSWLKAFILPLFLGVTISIFDFLNIHEFQFPKYLLAYPEKLIGFTTIILLFPIIQIAFIHHVFHLFINRFIPGIQAPEIGKPEGLTPGIISWWEGFYGWVVIFVSTLWTGVSYSIYFPFFLLENPQNIKSEIPKVIFAIFWITNAALLYQFEYLVRRRFISVYHKPDLNQSDIDIDMNNLRGEMGLHTMKSNTKITRKKSKPINKKLAIKLSLVLVAFLISFGIYLFDNLRKNTETTPTYLTSQTKPEISAASAIPTPILSPETDTFREAVNKAINAANLTQSAKSQAEWKIIVNEWESAISLMKATPFSSPNYAVAQEKIKEYQLNLNYAEKNAIVLETK